jgi:hypothetical protein
MGIFRLRLTASTDVAVSLDPNKFFYPLTFPRSTKHLNNVAGHPFASDNHPAFNDVGLVASQLAADVNDLRQPPF